MFKFAFIIFLNPIHTGGAAPSHYLNMQNFPRQLAMQSCVLCSFVRCGTSEQIEEEKKKKKKA